MRQSQQARRRNTKSRAGRAALCSAMDALEPRRLFSGESVSVPISSFVATTATPATDSITLDQHFTDPTIPGTLVTFKTTLGDITVGLTDAATPLTVANFLSYVSSGAYVNTIFHRSDNLNTNVGGSPKAPATIVQGGGYVVHGTAVDHIPTNAAVDDEFSTETLTDVAGTLAMAKTSAANSATSEWYFNSQDNTTLDTPTTDSNGATTSYTVFGQVIYTGMNVIDRIAALPTYNASSANSALNTLPVVGLTEGEATDNFPITANNFVYTKSITSQPGTNYTVTSSDNSLVTPNLKNGVLSFSYASGLSGTANITIVAKNLDGTSTTTSFAVTVPDSTTPTAGPVAGNVTAPNVIANSSTDVNVLANSTDSVAALNTSSVSIVTQPAHGTAAVNTSTGLINYTPTAGYTGTDSLTFTVADSAGTVSSAATVSLNVTAAPVTVTIGTAAARSLSFTQPGGATGHLSVTGGTAVVTFTGSGVTQSTANGVITATGADCTIASIVITNRGAAASLSLTSTGAVTLGSVTDAKGVSVINAPDATLSGNSSFQSINRLIAAAAVNSTLSLGSAANTVLAIPTLTNTTISSTGSIASLTAKQWTSTDGGFYSLSASSIGRLMVPGAFAPLLTLTGTGTTSGSAVAGTVSQAWNISGATGNIIVAAPASTFSLAATGSIASLRVNGNLVNSITALTLNSLIVTGTTTGATIKTTAASSMKQTQLGTLKFAGGISSSTISSSGKVNSLSTAAINTLQLNANLIGSIFVSGATTSATINTGVTISSKVTQIGSLRFGGAVTSSAIATSGNVGPITAQSLDSTQIVAGTIASVTVAGATTGTSISTDAGFAPGKLQIGRLTFGGAVGTSSITAVGNIGNVTAASLTASHIDAGVSSTIVQAAILPAAITDFTNDARLSSVTLGKAATAFSNSLIAAENIGSLVLGNIASANGGTADGVGVHHLSSIKAALVPGGDIDAGPSQLASATTFAGYVANKKLALGDFSIKIL